MVLGVPIVLIGIIISRLIITKSPEARQKAAQRREEIGSMNSTDFALFLAKDLCQKLDIRPDQAGQNLTIDLRIAPGEINLLLQNLELDDDLPVTSNDAANIQSVNDIIKLIQTRTKQL